MSASDEAKKAGLSGLVEVTEVTGVSKQTLINWYNDKPQLFNTVILGCVSYNERLHQFIARLSHFLSQNDAPQNLHQHLFDIESWYSEKIKSALIKDLIQQQTVARSKNNPLSGLTGRQLQNLTKEVK